MFLVVFDMKKVGDGNDEYASILYWLQCIEARGSACPVVLVGTHLDEVSSDHVQAIQAQLRQMYFGKFPNVKEFVAVNAKSSKNVPNLLRLVISLAQQDPSQQELVPASFLQVRKPSSPSLVMRNSEKGISFDILTTIKYPAKPHNSCNCGI